ncbi:MAG: nucleotide exchange factor GrpE [Actinomycetia bacterium]|nr:nucleotide exchange factor GrpE [Actinomycetes bacterium]
MDNSQDSASDADPGVETVAAAEVEVLLEQDPEDTPEAVKGAVDPAEELSQALEDLRAAEQRADASHQSYLRAVADLDNYRKRMRREQDAIASRASGQTVVSLLPVLDSFDAALVMEVSSEEDRNVLSGMKATYDLMMGTLQNQGLEIIPTAGEEFSPEVHEPINAPPPGDGELVVADEVRRGYRLKGRLLRASLVMVTRRSESE